MLYRRESKATERRKERNVQVSGRCYIALVRHVPLWAVLPPFPTRSPYFLPVDAYRPYGPSQGRNSFTRIGLKNATCRNSQNSPAKGYSLMIIDLITLIFDGVELCVNHFRGYFSQNKTNYVLLQTVLF